MTADNFFLPPNLPSSQILGMSKRGIPQSEKQVLAGRFDEISHLFSREDLFYDQIDLSQIEKLESDIHKSIALSWIAPTIPESLRARAMKIARSIKGKNDSTSATISLLPYVSKNQLHIICDELLDDIENLPESIYRSCALFSILEYTPRELLPRVRGVLQSLDIEDQLDVSNAIEQLFEDAIDSLAPLQIASAINFGSNILVMDSYAEIDILSYEEPISRSTNIQFPDECVIGQPVPLDIQLTVEVNSLSRSLEQIEVLFRGDDEITLRVFVSAESFDVEPRHCEMRVPLFGDSETVTFTLTPNEIGEQTIEIELYHDTARIGYTVIDTNVVEAVDSKAA